MTINAGMYTIPPPMGTQFAKQAATIPKPVKCKFSKNVVLFITTAKRKAQARGNIKSRRSCAKLSLMWSAILGTRISVTISVEESLGFPEKSLIIAALY